MKKVNEGKMLDKVRRWRKKVYEADKAKPPARRQEEAEKLARKLDLPVGQTRKSDAGQA